jgi:hypothetical protein
MAQTGRSWIPILQSRSAPRVQPRASSQGAIWAGPEPSSGILEEYADVLGDDPEFVAEIVESFRGC